MTAKYCCSQGPRRFGKSVFMSPLNAFLKIDDNNSGDTSFQNQIFKDTKSFQDKEFCNKYMGSTLSFLFL